MKTVHEVSRLTGVSVRALQYYDQIGLLPPAGRTEAGYRLYDDAALERLQQILLLRALEFSLKDIQAILQNPAFDRRQALEDQIALLTMRKEHLENLIALARGVQLIGGKYMNLTAFDTRKIDQYAAEAKARWGATPEYKELAEKEKNRTPADNQLLAQEMMGLFTELGALRSLDPAGPEAQAWAAKLQAFITENCYTCTKKILLGLGKMYAGGGEFTRNIDQAGGEGTADFAERVLSVYCRED